MSVPEELLLRGRKAEVAPREGAGGGRGLWAAAGFLLLLLLLLGTALAGCLLLSASMAELQGRVSALEMRRGTEEARAAWAGGPAAALGSLREEALLSLLQPRLDRLLKEKLGEGLAKLRTVREAPECSCPPGPPGKRGKVGRRGDPAQCAANGSANIIKISSSSACTSEMVSAPFETKVSPSGQPESSDLLPPSPFSKFSAQFPLDLVQGL
ncbi:collagen alpha-1(XXIII) chain-like [Ambystoma mexicanum]|uniref:collagen alpha-1(XXIII) chain-like n=1 Tax=Ambystoma mexicanum TaxID=8296 RepID=UPI0037E8F2D0